MTCVKSGEIRNNATDMHISNRVSIIRSKSIRGLNITYCLVVHYHYRVGFIFSAKPNKTENSIKKSNFFDVLLKHVLEGNLQKPNINRHFILILNNIVLLIYTFFSYSALIRGDYNSCSELFYLAFLFCEFFCGRYSSIFSIIFLLQTIYNTYLFSLVNSFCKLLQI